MEAAKSYRLKLAKEALKYYDKQSTKMQDRIDSALTAIQLSPKLGPHIEPLDGRYKGLMKYRLGNFRIIYSIEDDILVVTVVAIGPRGDVYK